MSIENPLWGAPRIHGELLKLGFEVAQSSVAKYMVKRRGPPSQGWRTFLRNHAPDIAAMDLFVVPTIGFDLLYAFVIVRLDRRDLIWISVTTNPTAEWIARQITEAFPWDDAPKYLIRDRDQIYGAVVTKAYVDQCKNGGTMPSVTAPEPKPAAAPAPAPSRAAPTATEVAPAPAPQKPTPKQRRLRSRPSPKVMQLWKQGSLRTTLLPRLVAQLIP